MTRALRGPSTFWKTSFPAAETPISQGGIWLNGSTNGVDWTDFVSTTGKAFGTQTGTLTGNAQYADSTALLNGNFSADHKGYANVFNTIASVDYQAEVEIRLRSNMSAHNCTGYEIDYTVNPKDTYLSIVRWEGAEGTFTNLHQFNPGWLRSGDVIMGTAIGSNICGYINGSLCASVTDTKWATGLPGIGAFLHNNTAQGSISNWGISEVHFESVFNRGAATSRSIASNRGLAS